MIDDFNEALKISKYGDTQFTVRLLTESKIPSAEQLEATYRQRGNVYDREIVLQQSNNLEKFVIRFFPPAGYLADDTQTETQIITDAVQTMVGSTGLNEIPVIVDIAAKKPGANAGTDIFNAVMTAVQKQGFGGWAVGGVMDPLALEFWNKQGFIAAEYTNALDELDTTGRFHNMYMLFSPDVQKPVIDAHLRENIDNKEKK